MRIMILLSSHSPYGRITQWGQPGRMRGGKNLWRWFAASRLMISLQNIRFAVITNTLIATVIFRLLLRNRGNRNIAMKLSFIFLPCLWSVISILTITVRIPIRTIWCHKINPYIFFVIVWKIRKIVNNSKRDCHVTIPKHNTFT